MKGKIFYIIGKSASGKDTILQALLEKPELQLNEITTYTTRPIRPGEKEGLEYHFVSNEKVEELKKAGKIIEIRTYNTVYGPWHYFLADDGQVDLSQRYYAIVGTVESYYQTAQYFGKDCVIPIYIEVDGATRLRRSIAREEKHKTFRYEEVCRRYLADEKDFSEEKLKEAGIMDEKGKIAAMFENTDVKESVTQIAEFILSSEEKE